MKTFGLLAFVLLGSTLSFAQGGPHEGMGHGGMGMADPEMQKDMQLFHYLLDHRQQIRRQVKLLVDGVETLTESDDAAVARQIQLHVESMERRMKTGHPIHQRDPLFVAVFANADKIKIRYENTPKGVKALETSADPAAAKLIQAHAEVVTQFLKNGRPEMMKNHTPPEGTSATSSAPEMDHEAMDTRTPLHLLPMMATHQKAEMRDHLLAVQEVVTAAAVGDFAAVGKAASRMGYSEREEQMCRHMSAGTPAFLDQAVKFHKTADTIVAAARKKDAKAVLSTLAATLSTCTACHAVYKQHIVDEATWSKITGQSPR